MKTSTKEISEFFTPTRAKNAFGCYIISIFFSMTLYRGHTYFESQTLQAT